MECADGVLMVRKTIADSEVFLKMTLPGGKLPKQ